MSKLKLAVAKLAIDHVGIPIYKLYLRAKGLKQNFHLIRYTLYVSWMHARKRWHYFRDLIGMSMAGVNTAIAFRRTLKQAWPFGVRLKLNRNCALRGRQEHEHQT